MHADLHCAGSLDARRPARLPVLPHGARRSRRAKWIALTLERRGLPRRRRREPDAVALGERRRDRAVRLQLHSAPPAAPARQESTNARDGRGNLRSHALVEIGLRLAHSPAPAGHDPGPGASHNSSHNVASETSPMVASRRFGRLTDDNVTSSAPLLSPPVTFRAGDRRGQEGISGYFGVLEGTNRFRFPAACLQSGTLAGRALRAHGELAR
jgi:hypothetical protein